MGWENKKPLGQFIGWLDSRNGEVYISNKVDIKVLLNFISEENRSIFPSTEKLFWIVIKNSQGLLSFDKDSNRTRKTDPLTGKSVYVRHLSINLPIKLR